MASRSHLKLERPLMTALMQRSWSPRSLVAETADWNASQTCSSSSWKAAMSSSSSGRKVWASSTAWRKLSSVFWTVASILSTSLVLIRRASSDDSEGKALSLSKALVIAPVHPALDRLTAVRLAGALLLVVMAL